MTTETGETNNLEPAQIAVFTLEEVVDNIRGRGERFSVRQEHADAYNRGFKIGINGDELLDTVINSYLDGGPTFVTSLKLGYNDGLLRYNYPGFNR